jgi:hypothetical protein
MFMHLYKKQNLTIKLKFNVFSGRLRRHYSRDRFREGGRDGVRHGRGTRHRSTHTNHRQGSQIGIQRRVALAFERIKH